MYMCYATNGHLGPQNKELHSLSLQVGKQINRKVEGMFLLSFCDEVNPFNTK